MFILLREGWRSGKCLLFILLGGFQMKGPSLSPSLTCFPFCRAVGCLLGEQADSDPSASFLRPSQLTRRWVLAAVELFGSCWFGVQATITCFLHWEGRAGLRLRLLRGAGRHQWRISLKPRLLWCCVVCEFLWCCLFKAHSFKPRLWLGLYRMCNKYILQLLYLMIIL